MWHVGWGGCQVRVVIYLKNISKQAFSQQAIPPSLLSVCLPLSIAPGIAHASNSMQRDTCAHIEMAKVVSQTSDRSLAKRSYNWNDDGGESNIIHLISSTASIDPLSNISSDISSDILSDISSDILSDISFDILSDIYSDMLSDIPSDILSDLAELRQRSGTEHSSHRLAIEVRHVTLISRTHSWWRQGEVEEVKEEEGRRRNLTTLTWQVGEKTQRNNFLEKISAQDASDSAEKIPLRYIGRFSPSASSSAGIVVGDDVLPIKCA